MANILNELTGRASGKVGNLVYRITNGVTTLCAAPLKPKPSTKPEVIERRNRFRNTLRLASSMNRIAPLKTLWKNTEILGMRKKLSAFSKMIQKNYPYISVMGVQDSIYLGPDFGFPVSTSTVDVSDELLSVTVEALGNDQLIDTNIEKYISLATVCVLTDPVDVNLEKLVFYSSISDKVLLNLANPLTFDIDIRGKVREMFNAYDSTKAFFILITFDELGNPVGFSQTFVNA